MVAGKSKSAKAQVSAVAKASCTTTNSARSSARRTVAWLGMDCAGLVQAIHNALISPSAAASNISTAVLPGLDGTSAMPHKLATSWRCAGLAMSRCALIKLAKPPTSRPPMALGCPVRENGPAPALPICPVAKCKLIKAAFLAVPLLDWFRPWQYKLKVACALLLAGRLPASSAPTNQRVAFMSCSGLMPHTALTLAGVYSLTSVCSASNPSVCAAM